MPSAAREGVNDFSCMAEVLRRAAYTFTKAFGQPPRWIASAPGRVNLIGEPTDYNDGFVLPMAIEHRTAIAADVTKDKIVTIHSSTTGETASFKIEKDMKRGEPAWANYVKGVVAGCCFVVVLGDAPSLRVVFESQLLERKGRGVVGALARSVVGKRLTIFTNRFSPSQV